MSLVKDPRCLIGLHDNVEAPRLRELPWVFFECARCHAIHHLHVGADGGPWTRAA